MASATVIDNLPAPEMLFVSVTATCDRHCLFCAGGDYEPSAMLDRSTVARAIREAKDLGIGTIVFAGGEPLLHPDIAGILDDAEIMDTVLFTNGGLLAPDIVRMIARHPRLTTVVNLSASGFPERDRPREGEPWDAIDRLAAAGARWGASLVAMRSNTETLVAAEETLAGLIRRGCAALFILEYLPVGRNATAVEILTPALRWKVRRLTHTLQARGLPAYAFPSFEEESGGCRAGGRGFLHINPSGGIEPCPFIRHSEENIHTTTLRAALRSPLMQRVRRHSREAPFTCPILAAHADNGIATNG